MSKAKRHSDGGACCECGGAHECEACPTFDGVPMAAGPMLPKSETIAEASERFSKYARAADAGPTPGPWHVGTDSTGTLLIVSGDGDNFDGGPWVYDSDKPEERPLRQADARLIAAAPDLLAALDHARDLLRAYGMDEMPAIIDAALSRARGGK